MSDITCYQVLKVSLELFHSDTSNQSDEFIACLTLLWIKYTWLVWPLRDKNAGPQLLSRLQNTTFNTLAFRHFIQSVAD